MSDLAESRVAVAGTDELVGELQATLSRAASLLQDLQAASNVPPQGDSRSPAGERFAELKDRLATAESDLMEMSTQLVETENQRGRLMNLYVATYQLHATLELEEVTTTIAEIARDLLGAEEYFLLLQAEESGEFEVALASGVEDSAQGLIRDGRYVPGDPVVDKTLTDGTLRMEKESGSSALAVVPLTVQGSIVGAIVILKLVDHKPSWTAADRDLLDLLAAHAASALFASRVYSKTDRKLRTLENLVKLVR